MKQFTLDFKCTKFVKASIFAPNEEEAFKVITKELRSQFTFVEHIPFTDHPYSDIIVPLIEETKLEEIPTCKPKKKSKKKTSKQNISDVPKNNIDGEEGTIQENTSP